jgi:hypothetical protein
MQAHAHFCSASISIHEWCQPEVWVWGKIRGRSGAVFPTSRAILGRTRQHGRRGTRTMLGMAASNSRALHPDVLETMGLLYACFEVLKFGTITKFNHV